MPKPSRDLMAISRLLVWIGIGMLIGGAGDGWRMGLGAAVLVLGQIGVFVFWRRPMVLPQEVANALNNPSAIQRALDKQRLRRRNRLHKKR